MVWVLTREQVPTLARGFSLLGAGGAGRTTHLELIATHRARWPIRIHAPAELDPRTPCVAVAYAGSTVLHSERLPDEDSFSRMLAAAQRWTGRPTGAVCAMEGAGINGLSPLLLAGPLPLIDVDFMGRALPRFDQISVLVDQVPGIIAFCQTGDRGVVGIESERADDVEALIRAAVVQVGGVSAVVIAGFTVGDLHDHAISGVYARALRLGSVYESFLHLPIPDLARALGGHVLGAGRVSDIVLPERDPLSSAIEIVGDDGAVLRLVARSELLVMLRDGAVVAATPDIIVAVDSISRDILQVDGVTQSRHVTVMSLPGPSWWSAEPHRLPHVEPAAFGLTGWSP